MGLQISHENDQGVTGNYWRLLHIQAFPKEKSFRFSLGCFKDQAASDAGKNPIKEISSGCGNPEYDTYFDPTVLDVVSQNVFERAYEYIKTQTLDGIDFSTATDV